MRISVLPAAAFAAAAAASAAPLTAQVPGLDNFSLERSQPPAPVVTPSPTPTATVAPPAPAPSATLTPTPRPSASPSATAAPSSRPTSSPTTTPTPTPTPSNSPTETAESDEPEATPSALPDPIVTPTPSATEVAPAPAATTDTGAQSWLWWLFGALALVAAGAAGWWWRGRREAAIVEENWVEPEPEPTPVPAAPLAAPPVAAPPAPAPVPVAPPTPGGLITTALRPALDFALTPRQAGIDSLRATLDYILTVRNTGRAEAQAVELEAWLFSVGSDPTGVLDELTALPPGAPMVPPFAMPANSAFDLPSQGAVERTSLAVLTAGERKLFVPMLGVRARFYDVAGVARVAVAAFMIGVERADQTRLAPLPLDRGARGFTGLAARRFEGR